MQNIDKGKSFKLFQKSSLRTAFNLAKSSSVPIKPEQENSNFQI